MRGSRLNCLSAGLRSELSAAIDAALENPDSKAVVLIGSPHAFSVGADLDEFGTPTASRDPDVQSLCAQIEAARKPVVAALSGHVLGGGLELAMACHFRVATADAELGLPDAQIGVIPGAGATQRLPRLVGVERALDMIVSGRSLRAADLAGSALVDLIADGDLRTGAVEFAERVVADRLPLRRARDLRIEDSSAEAFLLFARLAIASRRPPDDTAAVAIEAIGHTLWKPFDEGLRLEREAFASLLRTPRSRALRHVFRAEREALKVPGLPTDTVLRRIERVGIVGAGTMGVGIAMNFLAVGIPVVLLETTSAALDKGVATIRRLYEASAKKGKLSASEVERRVGLVSPTLSYDGFAEADLIVEAVYEDIGVKQQVFERLDAVCKPGCILASNTSYLNIDRIATFTKRPADVLGLHFFSPANVMKLLEVVRGAQTAPEVLATCLALGKTIGKTPVVSGVCDGFIGNRMISPYASAAIQLVNAGASPQQVDGALERFGMAMGPLRMADLAGLDIGWAVTKRIYAEAGTPMPSSIPNLLCEAGRFGQKTGAGWYHYEPGRRDPMPDPTTSELIDRYRKSQGIVPRRIDDAEIVDRCVYALVNEGARILEEGIAARASDIDVVYVFGYGFPRQRGGPMFYADNVGLRSVVRRLRAFAAEPNADPFWKPAPLLARLAEEGQQFNRS